MSLISNVAAVVVHHRSYETIAEAVYLLIQQGIQPENLVLIDNSEEPDRRGELRNSVPGGVEICYEDNRGYGAAVNAGTDYFRKRLQNNFEFLLVSTHETRPSPGALRALVEALERDPSAAVAGPTLLSGSETEFVWSGGGHLEPVTHIPSHYFHRAALDTLKEWRLPEERDWLDGAFLLYRWNDINDFRMSEDFFLYMEETDLHLRLGKAGRKSLWVPEAQVWQSSGGIPPYYLARNLRLLFRRHESILRRLTVVPYAVSRRIAADVLRRKDFSTLVPALRGLLVRLPRRQNKETVSSVVLVNPLGAALRHYAAEVESVLTENDVRVETTSVLEPSASGNSSVKWILDYVSTLIWAKKSARNSNAQLLVAWPVLGYWDIVLCRALGLTDVALVMHDPHPLVRAVGYSRIAKACASLARADITLLAHSHRALAVIKQEAPRITSSLIPHPILEPAAPQSSAMPEPPIIRVFGQYKPDRDLKSLEAVGRALTGSAVLEVHGRGWPEVDGWQVVSRFVEEERLNELMTESSVIVIPYKNFFQSGIAIRSLELGVPFVGPEASVLAEMVDRESALLVKEGGPDLWVDAILHAIKSGKREAKDAGTRWRELNVAAWSDWIRSRNS